MSVVEKAQVWCYRRTNGRVGGHCRVPTGGRDPVLLLDHVARGTEAKCTTPLVYFENGRDLVVVAAQGGTAGPLPWLDDLQANPETQVQLGAELRLVRARVPSAAEGAALRRRLVEDYADSGAHPTRPEREIPVVVLEPR